MLPRRSSGVAVAVAAAFTAQHAITAIFLVVKLIFSMFFSFSLAHLRDMKLMRRTAPHTARTLAMFVYMYASMCAQPPPQPKLRPAIYILLPFACLSLTLLNRPVHAHKHIHTRTHVPRRYCYATSSLTAAPVI